MSNYTDNHAATRRRLQGRNPAIAGLCRLPLALVVAAAANGGAWAQQGNHHWPAAGQGLASAPLIERGDGSLQVFDDRDALLAAAAGINLVHEDFSRSLVPAFGQRVCYQAVGHRANDPCFAPGDLQPGFGVRSSRGSIFDENTIDIDIVALGEGFLGMPDTVIGNNVTDLPYNPMRIDFQPATTVVGMDVYDGMLGGPVQVDAYALDDSLIGTFTVQPADINVAAFAGMISDVPIRRVDINAPSDGGGELIGRLLFGGGVGELAAVDGDVDLGTVAVGATAGAALELANRGHLALADIQLHAVPAPFAIAADGCSGADLAGGESCTLEIAFTGAGAGVYLASWQPIGNEGPAIELRADVVAPRLQTAPGHLDFGEIPAGTVSSTQSVTVSNGTGAAIGTGLPVLVPAPFSRAGGDCPEAGIELAPGASCLLEIAFSPQTAGEYDSDLTLYNADGDPGGISLAGRGVSGGTP
ncbi:MAG: choice-of-anchor D domain-containing protein [Xanthomonadales bacterium]|nr:choice-of-anchor D domain-containing protein [Xanthomonadales bacterium]